MKKACIVISTPFQALSAVAITEQFMNYDFDLYIIGNFLNFREFSERLKEEKIFNRIVTYKLSDIRRNYNSKNVFKKKIGSFNSYLSFRKLEKIVVPDVRYEIVFFAAAHSAFELLIYAKSRWDSFFYMFDDGVMTYRNVEHCLAENGGLGIIKRLLERLYGSITPRLLLYMPELFMELNGNKFEVEKLISLTDQQKKIVENLYDVKKNVYINQKILVIECKTEDYLADSANEKLEEIYEKLLTITQDVAFKRHPRDDRKDLKSRVYIRRDIPFEAINYVQDMTNIVLIAWDSTSVITPKLFWNQEPRVILLYKLIKGKLNNMDETDRFYQKFKHHYEDESRFMIPEDKTELERCFHMLLMGA